jgi:hypothetical protein
VKIKIYFQEASVGHMPIIPALGRLRHKDCKFEAILVYIERPCQKKATRSLGHEY